jgi:hypothetical protein
VHPRFRTGLKDKSACVGILTIIALVLAILLFYTAAGFYFNLITRISSEYYNQQLNDVNYTVLSGKNTFEMAICFLDSNGYAKDMSSQFNTYAKI